MSNNISVGNVAGFINSFAPFDTAESFDNVGLLVGDKNDTVKKALVCLDCTDEAISEAIKIGANLIITHHPVIFNPLKKVLKGSIVYWLINNSISVISAHTNLDVAPNGVADTLAKKMELIDTEDFASGNVKNYYKISFPLTSENIKSFKEKIKVYLKNYFQHENIFNGFVHKDNLKKVLAFTDTLGQQENMLIDITKSHNKKDSRYFGRIGKLENPLSAKEFAEYTKEKLGLSSLQYVNTDKKIKTVATLGGSGGSFMFDAIKSGADALVTGDIKHNIWLDAKKAGLCLVDAGHFQTEICIVPQLKKMLEQEFGDNIFFISQDEKSPFEFI